MTAAKKITLEESRLRLEAAFVFAVSADKIPPEQLRRHEMFASLTPATLRRWAKEDGWVEKREALHTDFAEQLDDKLRDKLHATRQEHLDLVTDLIDEAKVKIKDAPAKSYEGMLRAITGLITTADDLTRMTEPTTVSVQDQGLIPLRGDMSAEEIAAASKAMLQARRERMARLDQNRQTGDKPKRLEVVK